MVVAKLSCTETSIVCSSEVAMVAFLHLPWEKSLEAVFFASASYNLFVVAEAVAWFVFLCCWKTKRCLESFLNRVVFSSRDQTWDSRFRE